MKKLKMLFFLGLSVTLSSCTQPDGYIGKWFGSWYLYEILIDGEVDKEYADSQGTYTNSEITISFQGKIFDFAYVGSLELIGSWEYSGNILILDASYNAGSGAGHSDRFTPFPRSLHFPEGQEVVQVEVSSLQSGSMQWRYISPEGITYTYNFKKLL